MPSIDLVRVYQGTVKAMNMQQNEGQDIEISARANGFRRMIEKFRDRVSFHFMLTTLETLIMHMVH